MPPARWTATLLTLLPLAACSASGSSAQGGAPGGGGAGGGGGNASATGGGGAGGAPSTGALGQGGSLTISAHSSTSSGQQLIAEVYGHSPDTLYRLDPDTKAVTVVGGFKGCDGEVIDIALDQDSNLFGTTQTALHAIDRHTAECSLIAKGSFPNSLSFVPAGTVDPSSEALVGYLDADYVRIDTSNGSVKKIGKLSGGYISSGDVVSVKGGGTFLTVKQGGCNDCLVSIDPKTGDLLENHGALGYSAVFGLAFWAGRAYGFSNKGELFEISIAGGKIATSKIPVPSAPPDLKFWGAGSTTSAPPAPVPK